MEFVHTDLGQRSGGAIVEVTLQGTAANVRLMDSSNFSNYRNGRQHRYTGGHVTRSPVRLQIPHSGHWHVAVDLGGMAGNVRSSVRVLPGPLPALRQMTPTRMPPIASIGDNLSAMRSDETRDPPTFEYDVFISHATEDKDAIVRPLALALQALKLRVWYDEFELRLGDSLRRKIDAGLSRCRFGVVVLSPSFFAKNWPQYELDGLVTREMNGEQIILPVWHNISKQDVIEQSPSLADKVARNTTGSTIVEIAEEIASVIGETPSGSPAG